MNVLDEITNKFNNIIQNTLVQKEMEQSLRLLLTGGTQLNEQTLLNVFNKINSNGQPSFSSDLYILTAERLLDLPPPLQKHIIQKAETMVRTYNRLQEPDNQFQIRALICHSLINSHRAKQQRGIPAAELNLKAIDYLYRALRLIQSNSLYLPLALRASFLFYQVAFPFFVGYQRHHLSQVTPIVLSLLESHLTGNFDSTLRLYIAISLLHCCILDDFSKCDDASKQMAKLFTLVPIDLLQLRYNLLHLYTHFSRKSSGALLKQKLDLNEQLQKAVIMYQTARSNNATTTKDLAEVFKICTAFIESKKEPCEETYVAEIIIAETGRLAAQFNQVQVAEDCLSKASTARSPLARIHGMLITSELALSKSDSMTLDEKCETVNSCCHIMSLAMYQGDLVTVQDAAALLWSHALKILSNHGNLIKRYLITSCDILSKVNSQVNLLRSQMHFALAKIFESEKDNAKALDHLKKALSLDYFWSDHPTKLIHPFDRFIVPFYRMLNVTFDSYGQQATVPDEAYAQIAIQKKINNESLANAFKIIKGISLTDASLLDAIDASHFATVYFEIIRCASLNNSHQIAVDACSQFLTYDFDATIFDTTVEIQCESTVYGITSAFKCKPQNNSSAVDFVRFSIDRSKLLKKNRLAYNSIAAIWNSFFSLQDPADCVDYIDFLNDCVTNIFEADFKESKDLVGQFVNFYVQIVMIDANNAEQQIILAQQQQSQQSQTNQQNQANQTQTQSQSQSQSQNQNQKKKQPTIDPVKQKQLKSAEDILIKALPIATSIYEKKALVDRLVEIYGKRNQLPPNQSDPELSILVQLATVLNDKVQHKNEILSSVFSSIQQIKQPVLLVLLSEKACRLEMYQISIDASSKAIDAITSNTKNKDELYHLGLARFYRGLSYLKLIQPDLQEFHCQDKLRFDSAADFLKASLHFNEAKSMNNAKLSLSYFVSTVSVGEDYPNFRSLTTQLLSDSIQIARKVNIPDELRVRLFRIFLKALIDQKDWPLCKKTIQNAIGQLNKTFIGGIWELNLIVTFNADCQKSEQPLIDEMLRVKQLGNEEYQSKLWTFVADLSHDKEIQQTSLIKAINVLNQEDVEERFRAHLNYARWLYQNNFEWAEINKIISQSEETIKDLPPEKNIELKIEAVAFKIESTTDIEIFNEVSQSLIDLSNQLWSVTTSSIVDSAEDDDTQSSQLIQQQPNKETKRSGSRGKGNIRRSQSSNSVDNYDEQPTTIEEWIQLFQNIEKHRPFPTMNSYRFISNLLKIIDIIQNVGLEFYLLNFWYHALLFAKHSLQWPRFEQYLHLKLKVFLDRLNVILPLENSNDYLLTEDEKSDWQQKVGRFLNDPPVSRLPPLRKLLNKEAKILIYLGEYKDALYLLNSAMNQAEQVNDKETLAESILLVATIKSRSGENQAAIELLSKSGQSIEKADIQFWIDWFSAAFLISDVSNTSDFVLNLIGQFTQSCLSNKNISISETILVYDFYKNAALNMSPAAASSFYENSLKNKIFPPEKFLPTIDLLLAFWWRSLLDSNFPSSLSHFKEFGNEVLNIVNVCSDLYNRSIDDSNDQASLPFLCRFVDSVNLFGYLALKYSPVIRKIETKGSEPSEIGPNQELTNEFTDKSQEPLLDLSPTAAVMHFNNVKNIENIPKKFSVKMNIYLGQCLHSISTDNISLQSAVRYLWQGANLLTELKEYDLTGEVAQELFSILKESDITGSLFQYLIAQSVKAYRMRIDHLKTDFPPTNRERLFVKEAQRLRVTFLNPQISQMFVSSQKFFDTIPNGTSLVRLGKSLEEIRQWATENRNCLIVVIDNINDDKSDNSNLTNVASIIFGSPDVFNASQISLNFEEVALKYQIFKQIITTSIDEVESMTPASAKTVNSPNSRGKQKATKKSSSKLPPPSSAAKTDDKSANAANSTNNLNATTVTVSSFAKEALKLNNPEFQKFIDDLNEAFKPVSEIIPENNCPESVLILSSNEKVHSIPFECITPFEKFQIIYRDFSIMSALNRKSPCTTTPSFGELI